MKLAPHATLAALAAAAFSASLAAQCPTPDGLDGGPCCTRTQLVLPRFPPILQDAVDICWLDCDVENVLQCRMALGEPRPINQGNIKCGRFRAYLRFFDPTGVVTPEMVRRLVTGCAAGEPLPGPWFEGFDVDVSVREGEVPLDHLEAAAALALGPDWKDRWTVYENAVTPND